MVAGSQNINLIKWLTQNRIPTHAGKEGVGRILKPKCMGESEISKALALHSLGLHLHFDFIKLLNRNGPSLMPQNPGNSK